MTALVRGELYRVATIRSSWISTAVLGALTMMLGWLSVDMWKLLVGVGAIGLATMQTAQHYQHQTAVLLHLGRPHRVLVLVAQLIASVIVTVAFAALSGVTVLGKGHVEQYRDVLVVVPLMAVFAAAAAAILRRPMWLFLASGAWFIIIEGLISSLEKPLPFTAFLQASAGDRLHLLIFAGWATLAVVGAAVAIHRDLVGE
ncbi:hypothetical protein V6U90_24510 [Micromonospora sp. CPCC 206060]|uniref:hypothetical protein n=1 Tax=Micromonospora sp. CPCC 206060 TaxID=3122406 RepID=UPI002FF1AC30